MKHASARVAPPLDDDERNDFIRRYLVRCVEEDHRGSDIVLGGYAASWELAKWIKQWARETKPNAILRGIVKDLERAFRRGDVLAKNRIMCGVMEHAFELPAVRPLFDSWKKDGELAEAHQLATDWGRTHEE